MTCCKAVWEVMKRQNYGRILMLTSSTGVYGNYGHANDGVANMGLIGLMHALHLEGVRYGIRVNTLSPVVSSQPLGGLIDDSYRPADSIASITAAMMYLVSDQAPARFSLSAGEGCYSASRTYETEGIHLSPKAQTPERISQQLNKIIDPQGQLGLQQSAELAMRFISLAKKAKCSIFSRMPESRLQGAITSFSKADSPKQEAQACPKASSRFLSRLWRTHGG
ncbi:hypothetical protein BST96_14995 [Oceanicoccus sagamiensis]|uniref:Ketoreductase (KR) domain-containing protein n=1 Tax=Oceanicoccus sagamiensis TaxID=716816 RepID=A0A1X9NCJ1_9GAMM|nr:hypothetical protein BST96_14995 [Oceanicoccus sagamiensis]